MPEPPRLLVKIRSVPQAKRPRQALALGATSYDLEHLFDLPAIPGIGIAAAPSVPAGWYVARPKVADGGNPWDLAHAIVPRGTAVAGADELLAVEPDVEQSWLPDLPGQGFELATAAPVCAFEDQRRDLPKGNGFAWHLGNAYSGLKSARDAVMERGNDVVIAHIDTGYEAAHKTLPENLDKDRQRNFVDAGRPNDATDQTPTGGILRNRGHGTGTLSILAGRRLEGIVPPGNTSDYLGGAPKATIVPVRVADSVVHFWTSAVARAFDYARGIGADVISMSMGGLPSAAWADAVNAAYEAGVVIVCAAGNNFGGLPTRNIVYPARFRRVIAACGIMANMRPYYDQPITTMQGNYGPSSKMDTAMSAFTPNISWARLGCANLVDMDGAGTSSATPQVAAAAALWLRKHKDGLSAVPGWARVEAVRRALFSSAGTDIPGMKPGDVREMLGKGVLRASGALKMGPDQLNDLKMTPADSASFAFLRLLTGLGIAGEGSRAAMFRLEMSQLAARSRALEQAIPDPDADPDLIPERDRRRFVEALLDEKKCSRALQGYLEQRIGRRTSGIRPAARAAMAPGKRFAGSEMQRTIRRSEPPHRRLQIYAIDPSFSSRLDTAFINHATITVPWERSRSVGSLLQPGPVGECVEVVDVDPASGCAYAPVDLNDPLLLAQDGLPPSEGDPQFHQQMAYAVAMTTIRNFEIALGRAALWSPRLVRTKAGKEETVADVYVPRLRIYPHALREANAYYSPEKKAVLFGYFPAGAAAGGTTVPGSIIFTCLSHDIIAHETTHALLDGLHRRFQEATNPDVLAFHEAFADIVAIFQHFTFPTLLRHELRRTRGQLAVGDLMADLARQFGEGIGRSAALRSAIGKTAAGSDYSDTTEPHDRGAILVSAVFAAFLAIYERRTADLVRLASNGTGVLPRGDLHPDLVERLADEAAKTAGQVLTICIRALDYLPPVDVTFGDYLRALITADADLVPNDRYGYRFAFLEAFRSRGICVENIRTLSVDSLRWQEPPDQPKGLNTIMGQLDLEWDLSAERAAAYQAMRANARLIHGWIATHISGDMALQMGLNPNLPKFEVHSVRPARRTATDGSPKLDLVVVITQKKDAPLDRDDPKSETFAFRGGTTLIIDARKGRERIRYSIMKSINSQRRLIQQQQYLRDSTALSLSALYFPDEAKNEPFAMLHNGH